jgi:hypothetical protein
MIFKVNSPFPSLRPVGLPVTPTPSHSESEEGCYSTDFSTVMLRLTRTLGHSNACAPRFVF